MMTGGSTPLVISRRFLMRSTFVVEIKPRLETSLNWGMIQKVKRIAILTSDKAPLSGELIS
jgi:hypothetical protein